jgi:hypothetical protein
MRKPLVVASSLLVLGYLIVPASCGGTSVTGTDGGGGGSGGHGGDASSHGDTGTGGDTGSGTDSTTGKDGTSTTDAPASTEGGPATCPAMPPMDMTKCTAGGKPCTYPADGGTEVCDCFGGAAAEAEWNCATCAACPATMPTGTCALGGLACRALPPCTYSGTSCNCAAGGTTGTGDWVCGMCPAAEPTGMPTCTSAGLECAYGTATCTCRGGATTGDHWICEAPPPPCPTMQPAAGSMCTEGTGGFMGCTYGTTKCDCTNAGTMMAPKFEWTCT